ncbi:hypothetical protein KO566_04220 [Flavobacteriaceae bacterium XHP0103]|uniref:hypothetical protein n=1 Tax=Marixanthotalea marina TaxID=2844359 RepID=UPI00298A0505|nr:hypothetical protein [Marixanthotalea marina]MBU3821256.1 hypothetical protein [Marixanthotalea marina]
MNLKHFTFTILVLFATKSIFAQNKRGLIKEIEAYEKNLVSNASYNKDFSEVWNAIYIIATEEYSTISRESESRGYIEAIQENSTYKEEITMEIRGNEKPYRVSFQVKQQRRSKNTDGSFSNWQSFTSSTLPSYYLRLQKRLYELLNGPIELSDELKDKIERFNSSQSKNRKKILKGSDY